MDNQYTITCSEEELRNIVHGLELIENKCKDRLAINPRFTSENERKYFTELAAQVNIQAQPLLIMLNH